MSLRDLGLITLVCLVWAANTVVSKLVIAGLGAPPLFYAAARFGLVALVTVPWLLPVPRPLWRVAVVGVLIGGGNFALNFIGLKTASPSALGVVSQIGVPAATVFSILLLGERVRWRRAVGMAITLLGALLVMFDPKGLSFGVGVLLFAVAAVAGSLGAVMMKQVEDVAPLRLQAWVSFVSVWPLVLMTLAFERGQGVVLHQHLWPFIAAVLFSALIVSVLAHTAYYWLIGRYDVNLLQPLTLMTPLATIALGIAITGDRFTAREIVGTVVALAGVLIVALRRNHVAPLLLLIRNAPE